MVRKIAGVALLVSAAGLSTPAAASCESFVDGSDLCKAAESLAVEMSKRPMQAAALGEISEVSSSEGTLNLMFRTKTLDADLTTAGNALVCQDPALRDFRRLGGMIDFTVIVQGGALDGTVLGFSADLCKDS